MDRAAACEAFWRLAGEVWTNLPAHQHPEKGREEKSLLIERKY